MATINNADINIKRKFQQRKMQTNKLLIKFQT